MVSHSMNPLIKLIGYQVLGIGLIPLTAGMSIAMNVISVSEYLDSQADS